MTILVYPHGSGRGGELMWSLRSVAAWSDPAGLDIIVAGEVPSWLDPHQATGLHVAQRPNRSMLNVWSALEAAAALVGDAPFVLMNDDFYATGGPIDWDAAATWGPAASHIETMRADPSRAPWRSRLARSAQLLQRCGIDSPDSWELHVPLPSSGAAVRAAAATMKAHNLPPSVMAQRTLLAELAGMRAGAIDDPKLYNGAYTGPLPSPWMSTAPAAWHGHPGEAIRGSFTEPSPWERPDDAGAAAALSGPSPLPQRTTRRVRSSA
jgi:hypothetical protein